VLVLALVAGGHCREEQLDAVDAVAVCWGLWQRARATWYGQPNGVGPDANRDG
jgi:hypothetical protein